jgi:hypothetical protein
MNTIEKVKGLGLKDGDTVRYWHGASASIRTGRYRGISYTATERNRFGVTQATMQMPFVLIEVNGSVRRIAPNWVLRAMVPPVTD